MNYKWKTVWKLDASHAEKSNVIGCVKLVNNIHNDEDNLCYFELIV